MSEDTSPPGKRNSRSVMPEWAWTFILSQIAGQVVGWLLHKLGVNLRRVWSKLGNEKFWLVAIAALLLTAEWLRAGVNPSTLWNFPPVKSPFPHLSLYAAPLLDNLITSWIGCLAFSIIYCSKNYLRRFWWGEMAGGLSRRLMLVSLFFYPGIVAWFSLTSEASFLIPAWAQTPLWLGAAYPLGFIIFLSVETVTGRKIFGKHGMVTPLIERSVRVGSVGMRLIGESLYGNYRVVNSRLTGRTLEVTPNPNIKPTLVAFICFLGAISMTLSWRMGWSSMSELFSAFATVLYILIAACLILGLHKLKRDSEEKKQVVRVPRSQWSKFKFLVSAIFAR